MKADEKYLVQFMEGSEVNYIIPIYQRNYDWKIEQCKQLFDDLENVINKKLKSHFFGSIVNKAESKTEVVIIDGQQRITTISLLLLAICNYIKNTNYDDKQKIVEKIMEKFLINKWADNDKRIKLKPIKKDQESFLKLFENNPNEFIKESHLTQNYNYLYQRLCSSKHDVSDIYDAICNLMVVDIELKGEDNPQLIFESMNSTGLDLTEADKIRNFILMDKPYNIQKDYYEKYWNRIEQNVNYNTTEFIKDYLTIKLSRIPTYNKIYKIFKEDYIIGRSLDIGEVLADMYNYSSSYEKVINANTGIEKIDTYLRDITYLKYTLLYPFVTQVITRYVNNEYSEESVENTLKALLTYVVRRIICAKPTNALPKFFCSLDREIENIIKKDSISMELYDDVFVHIIENRKGYVEFPDDDEFKESFIRFKLYKMQNQVKNYILRELENYNNKERITIKSIDEKTISIEHIMPQTLTPAWKKSLGEKYMDIYEKYIDTIGNLTLTAYNSELQNKPYIEKKETYLKSKLYLSSLLEPYDEWNEKEIIERANSLSMRALEIWEEPKTEYVEKENEDLIFNLAETDISFINTKIVSFKLFDKEYEVSSWRDFEKNIISYLYDLDKLPLLNLIDKYSSESEYSSKKFSNTDVGLRTPLRIDDDVFVESHYNSDALVDIVRIVVEAYGLELDDVDIKLKENNVTTKGQNDINSLSRISKPEIKDMFEKIDSRLMEINSEIEKIVNKHYIAYRTSQNFLEVHFHVDWLTLYLLPNGNYNDPNNKLEFLKNRTWVLTTRLYARINDDIDYIMDIIKSSYEAINSEETSNKL